MSEASRREQEERALDALLVSLLRKVDKSLFHKPHAATFWRFRLYRKRSLLGAGLSRRSRR